MRIYGPAARELICEHWWLSGGTPPTHQWRVGCWTHGGYVAGTGITVWVALGRWAQNYERWLAGGPPNFARSGHDDFERWFRDRGKTAPALPHRAKPS